MNGPKEATVGSSAEIRKKIAEIAAKRAGIERQSSEASRRQSAKAAEQARHTGQAGKTSSESMRKSYIRQAESAQTAALGEGRKIADLSKKLADLAKDDGTQQKALGEALKREVTEQEAKAKKAQQAEERRRAEERRSDEHRAVNQRREDQRRQEQARNEDRSHAQSLVVSTEERLTELIRDATRPPKKEQLRILYATADAEGELRVSEEIRRVEAAVRASTHRDQVAIRHLPAATAGDLLNGLMSFRPHIVHFSGHSDESAIVFDTGSAQPGAGHHVTDRAFKAMVDSPDEPPRLVVLNSCDSAAQLQSLLGKVAIAIGMSDEIDDEAAIVFAARFYGTLAEGQSVSAAHAAGRADLHAHSLPGHDLPTLEALPGVDPGQVRLVELPD